MEALLLPFDHDVATTVRSLRALVLEFVPEATEKAQRAWRTINFDHHGALIAIGGHARWATIGFVRGVELSDPRQVLRGTGKSMRNVRVDAGAPIARAVLAALIREAARLNEGSGPPRHLGRAWGGGESAGRRTPPAGRKRR